MAIWHLLIVSERYLLRCSFLISLARKQYLPVAPESFLSKLPYWLHPTDPVTNWYLRFESERFHWRHSSSLTWQRTHPSPLNVLVRDIFPRDPDDKPIFLHRFWTFSIVIFFLISLMTNRHWPVVTECIFCAFCAYYMRSDLSAAGTESNER